MLYLGEPDFDDIEQAARLWLRYEEAGGLDPDATHMFLQMCEKPDDVLARAEAIKAEQSAAQVAQ